MSHPLDAMGKPDPNGTWGETGEPLKLSGPYSSSPVGSEGGLCGTEGSGLCRNGDMTSAGTVQCMLVVVCGVCEVFGL